MKIFNILFGVNKEELQQAKEKIKEINTQEKIKARHRKQRDEHQAVVRKFQIRLAINTAVTILIIIGGSVGYYLHQYSPKAKLDKLIAGVEEKSALLEKKYLPAIERIENADMRYWLKVPFITIQDNKGTIVKNYFDFKKSTKRYYKQKMFFVYKLISNPDPNIIASFVRSERILNLPYDFDIENLGSWIFLAHELVHAEFDVILRQNMPASDYLLFFTEAKEDKRKVVFIDDEMIAHGIEAELANIILDGDLEEAIKKNMKIDPEVIAKRLNTSISNARNIIWNAEIYFPRLDINIHQKLRSNLLNLYIKNGWRVITYDFNQKKFMELVVRETDILAKPYSG